MKKFGKLAMYAALVAACTIPSVIVNATAAASAADAQSPNPAPASTPAPAPALAVGAPADPEAFVTAAESTINGVVSVKSYGTPRQQAYSADPFSDPFFEYFFGTPQRQPRQQQAPKQRQTGLGSGVIVSSDGYIVTNSHVIADAERLEVTLNDNRNFNATVIGSDPQTDIALIKIEADDLHVIPWGDSEALRVGEWVLAVGNPLGFTSTVTSGIVSAKARNISAMTQDMSSGGIQSYIQTDAALNAGNSGGALVNLKGELVGINAAIYSRDGQYTGYSFAIPTSIARKVANDLKQYGNVQRAILGVSFTEVTPELIKEKDIKGTVSGIYVAAVTDRSGAKEAGLQEGDVIVKIGDFPTTNTAQLQEAIAKCSPGDTVSVTFYRNGKIQTKQVTLRNGQGNTEITRAGTVSDLGCAFAAVSSDTLAQLQISHGVQVAGIEDGPMKEAGIRDGFIVLSINNVRISKPEDVEKIYNSIMSADDADKVLFIKGIYPTGKQAFYAVPL